MGDIAVKILIGVATAAVWFALSRVASAAPKCDHGAYMASYLERQAAGAGR
ncbi:MAG: hypothetical protein WBE48_27295 [Xanthobacteraceae bacterium]|jgi:hypothetical protein